MDRALLLALPSVDGWPGAAWLSPRMPHISRIAWAMRFLRDVPVPVLWTGCGFCRPCRHRGADPGAAFHISSTARAAGLFGQSRWPSPVTSATGSAQGLVPMFSRGRATASIELPSERPALAVLLLRVLPFASGRSRLNDWRRSDRRLQPNSGFQRWRTACGRGPVIPIRDDGAPGGASSFPRHATAVPFLGTPSRAGRRPRGPLPYRPPSSFNRRTRPSCAPRAPIPDLSRRSARLSPGPPGDVRLMVHAGRVHPSRKDPHPSDAGCRPRACCHRRVRPGVGWPPRAARRSRPPPPHGTGHRALAEVRRVRPTSLRGSPREAASLSEQALPRRTVSFDPLGRHPCRQRLGRPDRFPGEW